jgi:hypothetical protein
LTFVEEEEKHAWATDMKDLLLRIKASVARANERGTDHLEASWITRRKYLALIAPPRVLISSAASAAIFRHYVNRASVSWLASTAWYAAIRLCRNFVQGQVSGLDSYKKALKITIETGRGRALASAEPSAQPGLAWPVLKKRFIPRTDGNNLSMGGISFFSGPKAPAPLPPNPATSASSCEAPKAARAKVIPSIPSNRGQVTVSDEDFFKMLLNVNPGIFLGDRHGSYNIVEYLSGKMPYFKQQGVSTLYMEMFPPEAQPMLDRYFETGENQAELEQYLNAQGWHKDLGMDKKYAQLVSAARESGIRIVGIDTVETQPDDVRLKASNLHFAAVVKEHARPGEKYLVFGGEGHSSQNEMDCNYGVDYQLGIPSVDFKTGEPGIYLSDRFKQDFMLALERNPDQPPDPHGKGR